MEVIIIDIKTKEIENKTIKSIDKSIAWTERIKDPIVYLNNKINNVSEDNTITEYGEDKIKYVSNRVKDESLYNAKKLNNKGINTLKDKYKKLKLNKKKSSNKKNTIKGTKETIKKTEKVTKEATKQSKRMLEQGRKLAIETTKKTVQITKVIVKAVVSSVKAIIEAFSSLIGTLLAGGSVTLIIVIFICLVALLLASIFGIFFSNENSRTMTSVITEVNNEIYDKADNQRFISKLDDIEVDISNNNWKEVIAVYSVKYSNDTDNTIAMYLNDKNVYKLKNIYYDFNEIKYTIKYIDKDTNEEVESTSSFILDNNSNYTPTLVNPTTQKKTNTKSILYVSNNSKTLETIENKYNFSEEQIKQVNELLDSKYDDLWMNLLYGTTGDYILWKQKGESWSNIKLGSSDGTIGSIGCLVTSISILIEKSAVNDTLIPFNPGSFVEALNKVGGFSSTGDLQYGPISKVIPKFEYVGRIELSDKSKQEKLSLIKEYQDKGYYLAVEVKGNTGQHWVAIMNVLGNNITMADPGSDSTDMWSRYNWNNTSQFIYFRTK